jgi:GWxTD domain-containing protein
MVIREIKPGTALILAVFLLCLSGYTDGAKDLSERYKEWLEKEVVYIISPLEKDVFLKLSSDRERDLFIEAFWRQRDPTTNTEKNEFREEHYRRINYVNHFFGRGAPKAGWQTDRGRIYIILGEPNDIQRFTGKNQVYPTEVWFYQGLTDKGLPPGFNLVFFQDGGLGEYKLYSPLTDGPQGLLTSYHGDQSDYMAAYGQLLNVDPTLAEVSMTLIPGERNVSLGRPSMSSDMLVNRVESTPVREIKNRYAEKFLEYKDIVEVEYTANYIDSDGVVAISKEPANIYLVNYAIEPERLSVNMYENKYYTTLQVTGTVKNEEDTMIYQFDKTIPLEFSEEQLKQISYRPVSIRDMFPLIPGRYNLTVMLKNEISKEFTTLERELVIPDEKNELQMTSLLLGYNVKSNLPGNKRLRPFQSGNYQVFFQANRIFLRTDKLVISFQLHGLSSSQMDKGTLTYTLLRNGEEFHSFTRDVSEYEDIPNIVEQIPLKDFPPAHYVVEVGFQVDGRQVLTEGDEFDLTHVENIPRPWIYNKLLAGMDNPIYDYILGTQYFNQGDMEQALKCVRSAYQAAPTSPEIALSLARIHMNRKEYGEVPPLLASILQNEESPAYEVYFLLGKAYQYRGELNKAVQIFDDAISEHGLNTSLLNVIGDCYFQMGDMAQAQAAWEKSLEINTNQPEIKKNLEILKEKKR